MKSNHELWSRLTFKTISYRKNYDLLIRDENFITEYEGNISMLRMGSRKRPLLIGEYTFSVWNLRLAQQYDVDMLDVLEPYLYEVSYQELGDMIKVGSLNIAGINKLIILHSLILRPDYKKQGVTEEFIEFMYRDHYFGSENQFIALVQPLQDNTVDYQHYTEERMIRIKESIADDEPYKQISAHKYFALDDLVKKTDKEMNELKLFALAARCGFRRIGESYLFYFTPNNIAERLKLKREEYTKTIL